METSTEKSKVFCSQVNPSRWQGVQWSDFVTELKTLNVNIEETKAQRGIFMKDAGGTSCGSPTGVLRAQGTEQISKLLQMAQKHKVPVTVRGGGLTTEGESIAYGGVLLDMTGMSKVIEINSDSHTVRTEAGIFWHTLAEKLRRYDLDYISAPLNFTSSVGGTLVVGGVDINSPKYGCSADQVKSLELVTPTGDIFECSNAENTDLFNKVLYGYGQLGVITKVTLHIRKFTPLIMQYYYYSSLTTAIEDMQSLVKKECADYYGILTILDKAINLLIAFDSKEKQLAFEKNYKKKVRGYSEFGFAVQMAFYYALHPWRAKEALYLLNRKQTLFPQFNRKEFMKDGKIYDRTVVFSRAVWRFWGGKQVVIPDISTDTEKFAAAVERGNLVCKKYFPHYTLYCVGIKLQNQFPERYKFSCIPTDAKDYAWGCEFEPMLEGKEYSRDYLQSFKNEIYDVGLDFNASYYRFGGGMKSYIPKVFGEEAMQNFYDYKLKMDPSFILNPEVIF